jgi:hypothetical protein
VAKGHQEGIKLAFVIEIVIVSTIRWEVKNDKSND